MVFHPIIPKTFLQKPLFFAENHPEKPRFTPVSREIVTFPQKTVFFKNI